MREILFKAKRKDWRKLPKEEWEQNRSEDEMHISWSEEK